MSTSDTIYTARLAGPELLQQGRANSLTCPLYREAALVAPSSGSCAVYRADGSVVETLTVSVVASVATVTTSSLAGETRGENWRVEWTLVVAGLACTFDRMAALCRRRLFPVVTDADLIRKHSDLATLRPTGTDSYQPYIDDCWEELLHDVRQKGSIPHLVMAPEDLKFVLLYRVLNSIYNDFNRSQNGTWLQRAQDYERKAKEAFDGLSFKYDTSDSGVADAKRRSVSPVTILTSGGEWWGNGNY